MLGLIFGLGCVERGRVLLGTLSLFFDSILEATFFDLGAILGGFWEAKMVPKSIFGRFFGSFFSHAISASILDRFLEAPNLKNRALASTGARFLQNRRFQKMIKKRSILDPFWDAKTTKFDPNSYQKTCFFSSSNFQCFFSILARFWEAQGAQAPPKNREKSTKMLKKWILGRVWDAYVF